MSPTVFHGCWWSLTISSSAMEVLQVYHRLLLLMVLSHCLSDPMEFLHVSHCLSLLLAVSHCLS